MKQLPTDREVDAMATQMGITLPVPAKDRARVVRAIMDTPASQPAPAAEPRRGNPLSTTVSTLPDGSTLVVEVTHFPKAPE